MDAVYLLQRQQVGFSPNGDQTSFGLFYPATGDDSVVRVNVVTTRDATAFIDESIPGLLKRIPEHAGNINPPLEGMSLYTRLGGIFPDLEIRHGTTLQRYRALALWDQLRVLNAEESLHTLTWKLILEGTRPRMFYPMKLHPGLNSDPTYGLYCVASNDEIREGSIPVDYVTYIDTTRDLELLARDFARRLPRITAHEKTTLLSFRGPIGVPPTENPSPENGWITLTRKEQERFTRKLAQSLMGA